MQQCVIDVLGHMSCITADVNVGTVLYPSVDFGRLFLDPLLDINFARLIPREGQIYLA